MYCTCESKATLDMCVASESEAKDKEENVEHCFSWCCQPILTYPKSDPAR